ncbi:MAG: protein-(glutamine-N5) methyltransferase, release factor-specific [Gammaproteobacteria bacterium]|nr:protein-(glutamine-N5) methyltransferase, release factor-specific [Gammaproteobacteria bacterium]
MNPRTIGECLWEATNLLPKREAEVITCAALNINRATLYSHPERLTRYSTARRHQYWVHRRQVGEPISYITGTKEFWSLNFGINRSVLIPRQDTEVLVEVAIDLANPADRILDLGCGSGAIAISIARDTQTAVFACDIDTDCIELTLKNASKHSVVVKTFLSDWFSKINGQYDLIVSNPPYLSPHDTHLSSSDLKWEPQHALLCKNSGLRCLTLIITSATEFLRPGGKLIVEHGYNQQTPVASLFKQSGFVQIETYNDLSGIVRATKGVRRE